MERCRVVAFKVQAQPAHAADRGVLRSGALECALGEVHGIHGVAERGQEHRQLTGAAAGVQRPAARGGRCVLGEEVLLLVPEPPEAFPGGVVVGPVGPRISHGSLS